MSSARDEFIKNNPIVEVMEKAGVKIIGGANERSAKCCFHEDGTASLSVNISQGTWYCHAGCGGGSVIDFLARKQGIDPKEFCRQNLKQNGANGSSYHAPRPANQERQAQPSPEKKIVATYDYLDETGQFLYQVVRFDPKDFRQRRKGEKGEWIWNMEGVRKVLFNLPKVLNPQNRYVWICEGEKDCLTLESHQLCATTNVGGAKKWMAAYSDALKGKDVILCGDNDDPGRAHMKLVMESLVDRASTIRLITLPDGEKDITDFLQNFDNAKAIETAITKLVEKAPILTAGIELPIQSMEELESEYKEHLKMASQRVLNLSNWLPSLGAKCRGLHPGEMVTIIADTGVGKTALIQNLARSAAPLPTLLFELELPGSLTFERFCAMSVGTSCREVEYSYTQEKSEDWRGKKNISHIFTCTRSKLTPDQIEMLINKAEAKMLARPVLVCIDYIQLMGGESSKRYDIVTDAAESLKRIAKATKTIIVVSSQIRRKSQAKDGREGNNSLEVNLHDAKESGGIENSSGLVLGAWRPTINTIKIKVLKNTKGCADKPGEALECNFNGACMTITEKSKIQEEDVPRPRSFQPD
ncbi:MAG TPA: DnaB-like helicase C-terminal domain-containing protein [Verrucomicrobiae bacterium]|jgi:hypothetical protein|nr:DnaB-like helicase C-terminal domain-containing protein [Verrucomicrobiae bacterium]